MDITKQVGKKDVLEAEFAIVKAVLAEDGPAIEQARAGLLEARERLSERRIRYLAAKTRVQRAETELSGVAFGLELDLRSLWDKEFIGLAKHEKDLLMEFSPSNAPLSLKTTMARAYNSAGFTEYGDTAPQPIRMSLEDSNRRFLVKVEHPDGSDCALIELLIEKA